MRYDGRRWSLFASAFKSRKSEFNKTAFLWSAPLSPKPLWWNDVPLRPRKVNHNKKPMGILRSAGSPWRNQIQSESSRSCDEPSKLGQIEWQLLACDQRLIVHQFCVRKQDYKCLYLYRLSFVAPWSTRAHTHSFWPTILSAEPAVWAKQEAPLPRRAQRVRRA